MVAGIVITFLIYHFRKITRAESKIGSLENIRLVDIAI